MFEIPDEILRVISIVSAIFSIIIALLSIYYSFRAKKIERNSKDRIEEYISREKKIQKVSDFRKKRIDEIQNLNDEIKNRETIQNLIIKCINNAIKNSFEFDKSMKEFADKLREMFESEYCAIGKISDGIAEDCIVSVEKANDKKALIQQYECLRRVKKVSVDNLQHYVCQALASAGRRSFFDFDNKPKTEFCNLYEKQILNSHEIINTTIICIRDEYSVNHGYIQFINSKINIKYDNIKPFNDALLGLIDIIINSQIKHKENRRKTDFLHDSDFSRYIQNQTDNFDEVLKVIMDYLSKEFHAGIISYRTPLLIGAEKKPIFILRTCYISEEIQKSEELRKHYFKYRFIREKEQMGGYEQFRCQSQGSVFRDIARDDDYLHLIKDEGLDKETFIMPIFKDFEEKDRCIITGRKIDVCELIDGKDCTDRFEKYYGIFKLRLFKNNSINATNKNTASVIIDDDDNETMDRLEYLSKSISIILNSINNKSKDAVLEAFQMQIKNNSFTKIGEFDEQCVSMIKGIVHPEICAIYRFDLKNERLLLSASTNIKYSIGNKNIIFDGSFVAIMNDCGIPISNDDLDYMFKANNPLFYLLDNDKNNQTSIYHKESVMIIPMIKKDNTRIGVILLIGKNGNDNVSNIFWEYDKKSINTIVNLLTRIGESDSERLTFLSRLSHELLHPVIESVWSNEYFVDTNDKHPTSLKREDFVQEIKHNLDRNMLYKYIIEDVEYVYSLNKKNIQYDFELCHNPEELIYETIRLFESETNNIKQLSFKTSLSELPPLYIDKNRMMQVFINLIKNAIRYANDNSEIKVSYEYNIPESMHEITFSNYGIGVDESEKEKIFELFFRGNNAKKKSVNGTGMGLFLVSEIMKAHKGKCIIKHLNNPTEFTLLLPNNKNL